MALAETSFQSRFTWPDKALIGLVGIASTAVAVDWFYGWRLSPETLGWLALLLSAALVLVLPSSYAVALTAIWMMSPVSTSGNTFQSSVGVFVLLAGVAVRLVHEKLLRWPPPLPRSIVITQSAVLGIVLIYAGVGVLLHHSIRLVAWDIQPFIEFAAFAILASYALRDEATRYRLLIILTVAATVKVAYDLTVFASGYRGFDLTYILADRVFDAAPFLLLPVLLLVALANGVRYRVVFLVAAALIGVTLVISLTRTFWLGLAAGLVTVGIVERRTLTRRLAILTVGLAVATMLVAVLLPQVPIVRGLGIAGQRIAYTITQIQAPTSSFMARRKDEVLAAWPAIVDAHFLGQGAGATIPLTIPSVFVEEQRTGAESYLHNYYAQAALNFGLPGVAGLLALAGVWMLALARRVGPSVSGAVAAGALAAWVMAGVQLALLSTPVMFHTAALMGLIGSLAVAGFARTEAARAPADAAMEPSALATPSR